MKKVLFALSLLALSVPACSAFEPEPGPKYEDPISYDSKADSIISYEKMEKVPDRAPSVTSIKRLILTYLNDDGRCKNRRFYTWFDGAQDADAAEQNGPEFTCDANSMELVVDFANPKFEKYVGDNFWFIIKFAGTWAGQSVDKPIPYATYEDYVATQDDDEKGVKAGDLHLWVIPAEGNDVEICSSYEDTQITKVSTAKFQADWKTIHCVSSADVAPIWVKLYAFDRVYLSSDPSSQLLNKDIYLLKEYNNISTSEFDIVLNHTAHINLQYVVESVYPTFDDKPPRKCYVSFEKLYYTDRFNTLYTYSGNDLGVTYTPEGTTFKVWSPISASVDLRLYLSGTPASAGGSDSGRTAHMYYTGNGVWEATVTGDLLQKEQRFYNYIVTNPAGQKMEAVDPYAHAVGYNGQRGYVYDPKSAEANPDGWDDVHSVWDGKTGYDIANPNELSIYEVHIRDLTMDETWISNQGNKRGTFNAFVERGTTYSETFPANGGSNYTVSTGFDHIKELGVKAVQLLPVFDSDNEESYDEYKFNWGYNPLNYNCVEGAYSSDPTDPMVRIREFKNLVKEFADPQGSTHQRVIMDVVYNHVSSAPNSCFSKIMPRYYFRFNTDGSYSAGSGCANDVRTEAPMMRKYIVDSLVWWAKEYKIKGFRFDLMGLIDVETIAEARNALTAVDPDIYIYGEGWSSGGSAFDTGASGSDTSNVYSRLYPGAEFGPSGNKKNVNGYVGAFNDEARNAIRGNNDSGWAAKGNKYPTWGFVDMGKGDGSGKISTVLDMLRGEHTTKGGNPNQMIAYVSCHDNYTVWDQLRYGMATNGYSDHDEMGTGYKYEQPLKPNSGGEPAIVDLVAGSIMAHGLVMASNGVAFMQGGEEIYRTKTISNKDNDAQGIRKTPEFDYLTEGGDEAIIRPFPAYMNYDPKNNPEDPEYDPNAPISVLCTGEVKMYGKKDSSNPDNDWVELVSHNSYKLPDSVNSFKWDRKIHVGNELTVDKFKEWKAMVALRNETAKYDYGQLHANDNSLYNQFVTWGEFSSDGGLGIYIPNGIHLAMSSVEGGQLSIGANQKFRYKSKDWVPDEYGADGVIHMYKCSLFVWKL